MRRAGRPDVFAPLPVLLIGLLLSGRQAAAGVLVDSVSSSSGTGPNISWSHTVGSSSGRLLVVGVSVKRDTTTVDNVTYGGTSLTLLGTRTAGGPGPGGRMSMWYMVSPPPGTATVAVTVSAAEIVVGGAISFSGVKRGTPLGTFVSANAASSTASVTVSSAAGETVLDVLYGQGDAGAASPGAGQTPHWNIRSGSSNSDVTGAGSTKAGAASVTMSWTFPAVKPWAIGAVSIKPASRVFNVD